MGLLSVRFAAEPLRSLAFGSISGSYAAVGTATVHPAKQFIVNNHSDSILVFSFDGVNDHFVLGAGTSLINDLGSNRSATVQTWNLAEGTTLYVKQVVAPTLGSVYFSVFYGAD